jgi:hypothetical protein
MEKMIKKLIYAMSLAVAVIAAGCADDIDPEVTSLEVSRLFSPINLEARIVNQTSLRLQWDEVEKAQSYTIEVFQNGTGDFSGTPVRTVDGVLYEQVPYVISGFAGETTYSVRVKAVGEGIGESKWVSTVFTTDAEQILFAMDPEDITPFTAIIRWPAGEAATTIVLMPGNIIHQVSASEIAAGAAEVTGLTSETQYSASLMNGENTRGTVVFTTLIDTSGIIILTTEDDLRVRIEEATEGDVFALMPGEYTIAGNININTSVEIVGLRPHEKPVLNGAVLRMKAGVGLRLKDLVFDGATAPDGNQTIIYDDVLPAGETYGDVEIDGCLIRNYVKGVFYASNAVLIESVTIKGTIYANVECVGGDFIDFRSGMTRKFDFINNTVYNSALNRDLFRMDNASAFSGENHAVITIQNNTFYNIISTEGTTRRILYIRLASHEIIVKDNIFAQTLANYSNQSATTVVEMSGNNYHNAPNLYNSTFVVHDAGSFTTLDPGFVNPDTGDFKVTNEDLKFYRIGDPRWLE